MLTKIEFVTALDGWFGQAQNQCSAYVDVTATDLHRHVGGYPLPKSGMSICCDVMRGAWQDGDITLAGSIKGNHGSLTIDTECLGEGCLQLRQAPIVSEIRRLRSPLQDCLQAALQAQRTENTGKLTIDFERDVSEEKHSANRQCAGEVDARCDRAKSEKFVHEKSLTSHSARS